MLKNLSEISRKIDIAKGEAEHGRSFGGHRHGRRYESVTAAGWDGSAWIAYARVQGRWKVVGREQTRLAALDKARAVIDR